MGKINNISESWKGHSFKEVETFVKEEFDSLVRRIDKITPVSLNPEFNKSWENSEYLNVESTIKNGLKTIKEGLDTAYGDYAIPFTIEATQDGTTIYFRQSGYAVTGGLNPLKVEISTDNGETWTEVTAAPTEDNVPGATLAELNRGEKVLIRGRNEAYGFNDVENAENVVDNCNFYADKPCYVFGNIMSLVGGDDFAGLREVKEYAFAYFFSDYDETFTGNWVLSKEGEELILPATTLTDFCYSHMFYYCTNLIIPPKLPATNLANQCYRAMFYGCTALTNAPALPAITLADSCYRYMFTSCVNLTVAPKLLATTLAENCYNGMFYGCTGLVSAPKLPATTLTNECYSEMFCNCTGLTVAPELSATTLEDHCYSQMFQGCTGLTTAPKLPATILKESCYAYMFDGCTSLTSAPELPSTTLAKECYAFMFASCTNLTVAPVLPATTLAIACYVGMFSLCGLTVAPELPATTLVNDCYSTMFEGCKSLTIAPELPATRLVSGCYNYMFSGCTNLFYIKVMFITTPGTSFTRDWVKNVKATGTFVKYSGATWNVTGNNGIPDNWTIKTAS